MFVRCVVRTKDGVRGNRECADEDDHCEYKTQQFLYLSHTHHCLLLIMVTIVKNIDPETVLKFDKILLPSFLHFHFSPCSHSLFLMYCAMHFSYSVRPSVCGSLTHFIQLSRNRCTQHIKHFHHVVTPSFFFFLIQYKHCGKIPKWTQLTLSISNRHSS